VWCGALWKKRIRWRRLSFNTQRISFRAEINEEPQMMSGSYRLVQSLFFGASHGRNMHKIRCTGLEHNLKTMFVKRFGVSTTGSRQEDLEYILLFTLVNDYIIIIEAVVSVNGSPVYKT
jgi:hypothetical protein